MAGLWFEVLDDGLSEMCWFPVVIEVLSVMFYPAEMLGEVLEEIEVLVGKLWV